MWKDDRIWVKNSDHTKIDVEKFDGLNNFDLWQSDMKDVVYARFGYGFERNKIIGYPRE